MTDPKWIAHCKPKSRYPLPEWSREKPKAPLEPIKYPPTKPASVDWERLGLRFDDELVIREIRAGSAAAKTDVKVGCKLRNQREAHRDFEGDAQSIDGRRERRRAERALGDSYERIFDVGLRDRVCAHSDYSRAR